MARTAAWGLLPDDVIAQLRKKEWDHQRHLKQRLRHQRPFPIVLSLKAPTGQQAMSNLDHFHTFLRHGKILSILIWWNGNNVNSNSWQHNKSLLS